VGWAATKTEKHHRCRATPLELFDHPTDHGVEVQGHARIQATVLSPWKLLLAAGIGQFVNLFQVRIWKLQGSVQQMEGVEKEERRVLICQIVLLPMRPSLQK